MPSENNSLFKPTSHEDRVTFSKTDLSDQDARWLTSQIPTPLLHAGLLASEEDAAIGYVKLDSRPRFVEVDGVQEFIYQYFAEEQLFSLGLVENLQSIRQDFLDGPHPTVIDLTHPSLENQSSGLIESIARTTTAILETALPKHAAPILRERSLVDASLCAGWEDNLYTSSVCAKLDSIRDSAEPHSSFSARELEVITTDDPSRYSVILFLSNITDDVFPGRLCLAPFREYCITAPFSALVFKRTLPHCTIKPCPYATEAVRHRSPSWASPAPSLPMNLEVISYPATDRMRHSPEIYSSLRTMHTFPGLFGTLQNFSEWLLRVANLEMKRRTAFGFSGVSLAHLAKMFRFKVGNREVSPRIDNVAWDMDETVWQELEARVRFLCSPFLPPNLSTPRYLPIHITHVAATRPDPSLIQVPAGELNPESTSRSDQTSHGDKDKATVRDSTEDAAAPVQASTRCKSRSPSHAIAQQQPSTQSLPSQPQPLQVPDKDLAVESLVSVPNSAVPQVQTEATAIEVIPLVQPEASEPFVQSVQSEDSEPFVPRILPDASEPIVPQIQPENIPEPIISDPVSAPCSTFALQLPKWQPGASLTLTLLNQIRGLFDVESLRSAIEKFDKYQKLNPLAEDTSSPLPAQLQMHLQVLKNGNSPLHGYEHLVSRASICSIIQKAPELKQDIMADLLTSDLAQRFTMSAFTLPDQTNDAFWKDFQDRNLLLCQIVQNVGSIILLAPGLYRLILTAGGKSAAGKSAVRSSLQPAVRSRIVESCLWHSQNSLEFMQELQIFWYRVFQYHPLNEQPSCTKLHQTILPFVPSPGPCFRTSFQVLHEIINHAVQNLTNPSTEDILWSRPFETDRLLCVREAGLSLRLLENARMHKNEACPDAQTVFRNILCIRTLFFGNPSKMRDWTLRKSAKEIEKLVTLSSVFDEAYGQSRTYGQYQFPSDFNDFQQRLRSCWRADWPIPARGSQPSWQEVHSAASNADGAGDMLRSLIASDMARLGWSQGPEPQDWRQLITPASATALGMLFPSAPKTFGPPNRRHVDPALAEVVAVSLCVGLDDAAKEVIGFDRIFVEHLLSRFYLYFKEGWILETGGSKRKRQRR